MCKKELASKIDKKARELGELMESARNLGWNVGFDNFGYKNSRAKIYEPIAIDEAN